MTCDYLQDVLLKSPCVLVLSIDWQLKVNVSKFTYCICIRKITHSWITTSMEIALSHVTWSTIFVVDIDSLLGLHVGKHIDRIVAKT